MSQDLERVVEQKRTISTSIVDEEVFEDIEIEPEVLEASGDLDTYLDILWDVDPEFTGILRAGVDLEQVRETMYHLIDRRERYVFSLNSPLHVMEKATIRECARVLRSVFGPINEKTTGVSALKLLWRLARGDEDARKEIREGFLLEFIHLVRGLAGQSGMYGGKGQIPEFLKMEGREAAIKRTEKLDEMSLDLGEKMKRYPSGLEQDVIARREENRKRILDYYKASEEDWEDHEWHLAHVIKDAGVLADLLTITEERRDAVARALGNKIPFGITPYYLSMMDTDDLGLDHAIRAQVLPPPDYVDKLVKYKDDRGVVFDFMGEHDTSPVDLVTRRYPVICILKPFNTCPQICVYCQRNWEIDECMADDALAPEKTIQTALDWLDEHPGVGEVLVTGGDPLVMNDDGLEFLLSSLAAKKQIFRIRFGTRTPVTLPQRWTDDLVKMLEGYCKPGVREVAVVTHFSHSYEITPRACEAVQKIRLAGMGVYNQEVFTIENSRRFETVKLRRDLRSIGVDPYYTFNMKGKDETRRLMVPIARILQERKEEARLMPGMDRTDEPVFNVPRLGKNHLRAWQDHRVVMIRPGGSRVYEMHPWEKYMQAVPPYNYRDVPIYDYLKELESRGEDPADYWTIWYYY